MPLDRQRPLLCYVCDLAAPELPPAARSLSDPAWREIDIVQARGKRLSAGELEATAAELVARLAALPTLVVVNDRLDVALAAGAGGCHLGRDDLDLATARAIAPPPFVIGASTHDRDELLTAARAGADYAGLGAFHPTETKPGAVRLDPDRAGVAGPIDDLGIPVLAIGGLTAARVEAALGVPCVTGVAVASAIERAPDPDAAVVELRASLTAAWAAREAGVTG